MNQQGQLIIVSDGKSREKTRKPELEAQGTTCILSLNSQCFISGLSPFMWIHMFGDAIFPIDIIERNFVQKPDN